MIHAYAREQLDASGEAPAMRRRHGAYFLALAERAEPELRRAGYDRWCRILEGEIDNIRAVLEWSLGEPAEMDQVTIGVRLAAALGMFWYGNGYHAEGFDWTQQLLARLDSVPVMHHPSFLISSGRLAWFHDIDMARRLLTQALDCSRELDDALQTAWASAFLAYALLHTPDAAMSLANEALAAFRRVRHLPGIAQTLNIVGEISRISGNHRRAQQAYEECLAVCQQTGEAGRIAYMYTNLAFLAQHEGNTERAMQLAHQGLQLARERNARDATAAIIAMAGSLCLKAPSPSARYWRAARLLGAAAADQERAGARLQPSDTPEYARILADVRAHVDGPAFHAAWTAGRRMTLEQAIAAGLEEPYSWAE
jgi:tetratricopeptide (TPR) repeat protein